ncbi:STAS/SEC14 domain-containing protein [Flavobacterium eburneipallidum]|uniref:STAS/SEC14 domain-containing protein n=1 Tax=Flavobacterium eburneipallidum TaxID=3003263 RepID=UPI0022AC4CFB|nr:STAS/SEC14 domain-containing protein [Flavobacterium eburneipallidum]
MIEKIQGLPDNMVGFRSEGEVVKEDLEFVTEEVKLLVEKTDKLNYLLFLDNSPADFTLGAWLQDALLGIKNITKWNRAAIVTDSQTVIDLTDVFSKIMPGTFRGFKKAEYHLAIDWTSEKIDLE